MRVRGNESRTGVGFWAWPTQRLRLGQRSTHQKEASLALCSPARLCCSLHVILPSFLPTFASSTRSAFPLLLAIATSRCATTPLPLLHPSYFVLSLRVATPGSLG
ncbi:hypothetical protein L1887_60204 [Cichorium endivia]|nr:hypothetical protein L1887_60204 [Cichorium endivia]